MMLMRRIIHGWLAWFACASAGAAAGNVSAAAADHTPAAPHFAVVSRNLMPLPHRAGAVAGAPRLDLTAVLIEDTGWSEAEAVAGITEAVAILAQCGLHPGRLTLLRVSVPDRFRDLSPQASRILAAQIKTSRPTLYFVRNTRNRPAFDAEAFGAGNTVTRPELTGSVWITRQAADLPETIAHELFHVLANSGAHSEDRASLMHRETAPGRRGLTALQCAAMLDAALQNRLMHQ